MKSLMRWSAASSVALITGLSLAAPAFADLPGIAPYEIEAKEQYCASGGRACTPGGGPIKLADLRFAYVDVLRITPPTGPLANLDNRSLAEPQALAAKCAGPHSVDANGTIHTTVMFVFAGPTNIGYDGGTVHGSVVLQDGGASSTHARAVVAANGSDPVSGDTASVVGALVANNANNTRVGGGYLVTLSGPQYDEMLTEPPTQPTPLHKTGTMSCSTDHTPVSTPFGSPAFFQAQKDAPPNPNS